MVSLVALIAEDKDVLQETQAESARRIKRELKSIGISVKESTLERYIWSSRKNRQTQAERTPNIRERRYDAFRTKVLEIYETLDEELSTTQASWQILRKLQERGLYREIKSISTIQHYLREKNKKK